MFMFHNFIGFLSTIHFVNGENSMFLTRIIHRYYRHLITRKERKNELNLMSDSFIESFMSDKTAQRIKVDK